MTTHELAVQWLLDNRPGTQWALTGDSYADFQWFESPETKPTAVELGLE